jgi:hypothetical protein
MLTLLTDTPTGPVLVIWIFCGVPVIPTVAEPKERLLDEIETEVVGCWVPCVDGELFIAASIASKSAPTSFPSVPEFLYILEEANL